MFRITDNQMFLGKVAVGGAFAGAALTMLVGFNWGGWMLGSTAMKQANTHGETVLVAALAPICAEKFRAQPDAQARIVKIAQLQESESWKVREQFPEKLVTLPGESYVNSDLVEACTKLILAQTKTSAAKTSAAQ